MDKTLGATVDVESMQEIFRRDVVITLVHHLRVSSWMQGVDRIPAIWASAGVEPKNPGEIYNPSWTVADWGLTWADIADLDFAIYLDNMFQFGHLGLRDIGWEPMEDETGYTWTSLILMDMFSSQFLAEWTDYGGEAVESVARCLQVAELANARCVLETGEPFSPQLSAKERGDEHGVDGLTVRQIALLAGMEEMSIRAAANPKRPNPLVTFSENGRTRITLAEAKRWLESKGRYIPIKTFNSGRNDDLRTRPFASLDDLMQRCRNMVIGVQSKRDYEITLSDQRVFDFLEDGSVVFSDAAPWSPEQQREALSDPTFVSALAETLELPSDLFSLRVREVLVKDELQRVQETLRDITTTNGGKHA